MIERQHSPVGDQAQAAIAAKRRNITQWQGGALHDEPANAMCYRKKGSGTIGNDSCIRQHSLGVSFLFYFLSYRAT